MKQDMDLFIITEGSYCGINKICSGMKISLGLKLERFDPGAHRKSRVVVRTQHL